MQYGATMTTTGALTNNNQLRIDDGGAGGSTLTLGGAFTNTGYFQDGDYYMTAASTTKVNGVLTNTGTVLVDAGNTAGANALLNVTGAAPGTLTGTYQVYSNAGSAAVEFGSGAITSIGGSSAGDVSLAGARHTWKRALPTVTAL